MFGIKKLDLFILKNFTLTFVGAFFICQFIFMMQFTWRYIDELIGKGLSIEILGKFFWYMGITLVPTSLPLAILLASLIAFGNMGERLELLAMKASGISLIRIMLPIFIMVLGLTGMSFSFQNNMAPRAQISLSTLLFSMKQSSPAVEIPEGIFYSGVPNVNLYVQRKNTETGMLYQVIIYKTDQGFDRAQILLADSGRLEMTADRMHLRLSLWKGEQFENLQSQNLSALRSATTPYDRETFNYKELLIDFDSNFNLMDANMVSGMASTKNMEQIRHSVDSMNLRLDSVGKNYFAAARASYYKQPALARKDSLKLLANERTKSSTFDSIINGLPLEQRSSVMQTARQNVAAYYSELEWKSVVTNDGDSNIRRHWVEWHKKITLSLSCLFFFFVGAPLGAIIRKGGLGMPTVISVLIFIFYYIINTSGMKMARDGSWSMVYGMWISSWVLIPFGVFLTYKSNRDSVVFNMEAYTIFFRNILGLRSQRHIFRKEVIISDPDYKKIQDELNTLRNECTDYSTEHKLMAVPNYVNIFFKNSPDHRMEKLGERLETIVEELSNSRDPKILQELNNMPVIYEHAHTSPFTSPRLNKAAGILFPIGFILWIRIWRFRLRLLRDLKQITHSCDTLTNRIAALSVGAAKN